MGLIEAIILAVLAASTPLLLAATGELVTERAGVLNLGVEGMMIVGAACGFGGAWLAFSGLESISQISPAMRLPLNKPASKAIATPHANPPRWEPTAI